MEQKETILIVDDTQINIDVLLELLSDYDVVVALDGVSALEILQEENEIDLILLDVMMPVLNGFEVCQIIKKNPKISNIPIIFITAKTDEKSIETGFDVGGVDYILKPFKPKELLARVKTQLNLQRKERQLRQYNKFIALGELMENIAHQWRQPLSAISVTSSGMILQKEMGDLSDEHFYASCNMITKQTQYLSKTIEELQELLRNNKEETTLDLENFITTYKNELFDGFSKEQITLKFINKPKIKGSSKKLLIVLRNILQNSLDIFKEHNQTNGKILLEIRKQKDSTIIDIIDNGGGIKKENLENIFDPYFTTKHKSLGKGMGLYTVYHLLKSSFNATINVRNVDFVSNEIKEKGVHFEIVFNTF